MISSIRQRLNQKSEFLDWKLTKIFYLFLCKSLEIIDDFIPRNKLLIIETNMKGRVVDLIGTTFNIGAGNEWAVR